MESFIYHSFLSALLSAKQQHQHQPWHRLSLAAQKPGLKKAFYSLYKTQPAQLPCHLQHLQVYDILLSFCVHAMLKEVREYLFFNHFIWITVSMSDNAIKALQMTVSIELQTWKWTDGKLINSLSIHSGNSCKFVLLPWFKTMHAIHDLPLI